MTITLATLKDATAQQVFDQVAAHLLKQNARSTAEGGLMCQYRGDNNLMCAAGCLIADDEYKPFMDMGISNGGGAWITMVRKGVVPEAHCDLIMDLQKLHDNSHPELFKGELRRLAGDHDLTFNHEG